MNPENIHYQLAKLSGNFETLMLLLVTASAKREQLLISKWQKSQIININHYLEAHADEEKYALLENQKEKK